MNSRVPELLRDKQKETRFFHFGLRRARICRLIRSVKGSFNNLIIIVLLFLLSPSFAQQIPNSDQEQVIDVGFFTVNRPPGKRWQTEVFKEKGEVVFTREEGKGMRVFGEIMIGRSILRGLTVIKVNQLSALPQVWNLSEEEMAEYLRDEEDKKIIEAEAIKGQFKIEYMKKGITAIDGKKLYSLSYKTSAASKRSPKVVSEVIIYYYFPETYKRRHIFYAFLTETAYLKGNFVKMDLAPIHAVIKSFKMVDPLDSILGIDGELVRAVDQGDLAKVQNCLEKGANINFQSILGTPLILASLYGDIELAKLLIDKGAEINLKNDQGGQRPLMAAILGREEVARLLIEKGADINAKNDAGWTPLMFASALNKIELVKLLIEKGAQINEKDNMGRTALIFASRWGAMEIVNLLLEAGAEINAEMNDGWTALMDAIDSDHIEIAKLLIERGANVNVKSNRGWTPLMAATFRGHPEIVKLLIEKGADVNAREENGQTVLKLATVLNRSEIIKLLKEAGAK